VAGVPAATCAPSTATPACGTTFAHYCRYEKTAWSAGAGPRERPRPSGLVRSTRPSAILETASHLLLREPALTPWPRVAVDATAVPADRGGVGRYVDELLPALAAEDADLAVVCRPPDVAHYRALLPDADVAAAPAATARRPVRLAWEQVGLPEVARRLGADLLHCPHYTMPLAARLPVVTTLHDATFFTHPELHQPLKRRFFRAWSRLSLARAARCITPSGATRDELARVAAARVDRIDVAHHGVDAARFHVPTVEEQGAARAHLGIDGPYVAFLGTLEPRKNVPALVRAWGGLAGAPPLVLAGGRGWDDDVDRAIAELAPGRRVLRPGYLPLELLAGFLGAAELVVYPSLGEGFGLPVLEAMACGAPVLTTRRLALPEVGGDAVAYAEPDVESLGRSLRALLADAAGRRRLSEAGAARAARFDWRASARAHLATYRVAAGERTAGPRT
jgi:glycosyltransferase involved in cell wall biosynthesis